MSNQFKYTGSVGGSGAGGSDLRPGQAVALTQLVQCFQSLNDAFILCRARGTIVFATDLARQICNNHGLNVEIDGEQVFEPVAKLAAIEPQGMHRAFRIPGSAQGSGTAALTAEIKPAQSSDGETLYWVRFHQEPVVDQEVLATYASCNGLSRTETRVLTRIYEGLNSTEIATAERMSVHTVRAHTKSIMRKTELHRQSLLVRSINAFARTYPMLRDRSA